MAGIGTSFIPSAWQMALITAGAEPMAPASPQPFKPSGWWLQGAPLTVSTVKLGRSSARGGHLLAGGLHGPCAWRASRWLSLVKHTS